MHIPSKQIKEVDVLTFEDALSTRPESEQYDRERWLYVPDFYSEYRYILGTNGDKPLITIGINPSTAAPDDLDNTLKSVERIALFNGFNSFIMFNVYAQRATNPDDMDVEFNENLHIQNMKALKWVLDRCKTKPSIWGAWGTIIEKRPYLYDCVKDMLDLGSNYDAEWLQAGKPSKKGHPHHPLYLKKDSLLYSFDVNQYLNDVI